MDSSCFGVIKIICDAFFDFVYDKTRVGNIVRDHLGVIITGDSACFTARSTSTTEAFVVQVGVHLAIEASFQNVQFEYDNT
ncbi:hypothetical protein V6N13_044379 [Hibiscus sabdariffa]